MKVYYFINRVIVACVSLLAISVVQNTYAESIHVVAAENMYGDIAQQIGGNAVKISVILNNPDQDPHLFELSPSVGNSISQANLVIMNGLGYDEWMKRLLSGPNVKSKHIISMEQVLGKKDGDNPHLWYDLNTVQLLAERLEQFYSNFDPLQKEKFVQQYNQFHNSLTEIKDRIQKLRNAYPHVTVAATEPVFGLMAEQLGFKMLEEPYQWVIMNGGEPTPKQVAQFEEDIKIHKVQILFYNDQVMTAATESLKKIAVAAKIPVVGVSEIMPLKMTYQSWMNQVLDKVESALKSIPK